MDYNNRYEIEGRINALNQLLAGYDYIGTKIAMGRATIEDYADQIAKSAAWAREKEELTEKLAQLEDTDGGQTSFAIS